MSEETLTPPRQWDHDGACSLPGSLCKPDDECARCGFPAKEHPLYPKPKAVVPVPVPVEPLPAPIDQEYLDREAAMRETVRRLTRERDEAIAAKNGAYRERDMCVALIAGLARANGCKVGLGQHEGEGDWDPEWRTVVYVDLLRPKYGPGQVSWHIHESEREWFEWMPQYSGKWDGHDTDEKYRRVLLAATVTTE